MDELDQLEAQVNQLPESPHKALMQTEILSIRAFLRSIEDLEG